MPRDLKRQVLLIGNLDDSVFQFISKIFCNDSVVTLETWPWSFMNPLHVSKQGHWSAPIGPEFRSCIAVTDALTDSSADSLNRFMLDSKVEVMYLLTMSPVNNILTKEFRNFYTTSKFINFRFKYSLLFSSYIKFHSTKIIRLRYLYLFFVLLYPFLIFGYFFFMIFLIGIDLIINNGQVLYEIKKKLIT